MRERTGPDKIPADASEQQVCRFSNWCMKTGYSLEYWEVFATNQRVIFCFVGESYRSLLLKADMGAANRERLSNLTLPEIETFDDRNFSVPISNLQKVELIHGSRTKRTSLRFTWDDREMRLYGVTQGSSGSDAIDNVARLTEDDSYETVTITVSKHRFDPLSRGRRAVTSLLSRFA